MYTFSLTQKSLSELGFRKSPPHKNISPNYLREPKTISKQMISSSAEDIAMAQTRNLLA